MQRVWIVGEPYAPEENTTAYYLTQTAEGLARKFDVAVLCGQPSYLSRGVRAPAREILNKVDVKRCKGTTLDKNILPFRLLNMLTLGGSMFFNALFRFKKTDKVLVVTAPPSLPFLVALACQIRNIPFVFLLHDSYPEVLTAVGSSKADSFLVKIINRLNRWLYRRADKIITVGRDMESVVKNKLKANPEKVLTIQNWASLEEVSPVRRDENGLLQELNLQNKFVLLYAGNMGPPQDVESIVAAADLLQKENKNEIHFLFVGAGGKKKWLEAEIKTNNLKNITVLPPRPRTDQTNFLNACDVALVPLIKGMKAVAMPSRTYNFLAAGKPVLAIVEAGSEPAIVVEEDNVGWVSPPHEPEKLKETILKAFAERGNLAEIGSRARRAAETKYSFETALGKYFDVFGTKEK